MRKLLFVMLLLMIVVPATNSFSTTLDYAGLWSDNRYYESTAQTEYFMLADAGASTDQYDVFMYIPSWPTPYQNQKLSYTQPFGSSYDYGKYFKTADGYPAPGTGSYDGRDVYFYIDENKPEEMDPNRHIYHAPGTYQPLDFVQNVQIYGGLDVNVSWQGVAFASDGYEDQYRVRIIDDSGYIFFDSGKIPVNASNLYDYHLGDLSGYGPNISIAIEARESVDQYGIANRSRYYASASESPVPEPATMLLFGAGLVGLAGFGRKKFKK